MSMQDQLWRLLDQIGPFIWWIKPSLCLAAFFILLLRAPPVCWLERVARYLCFVGLLGIMLALMNSALGPIGETLFFLGYVLTLMHRRTVEYRAGEVRPPTLPNGAPHALVAFVLCALLLSAGPALAQGGHHGQGHAENHDWYNKLRHPNSGASCCDNRDCRPTRAYIHDDGAWRAQLNGRWLEVPKDAVLKTRAPDGNSHICANEAGVILCFVGGEPKS